MIPSRIVSTCNLLLVPFNFINQLYVSGVPVGGVSGFLVGNQLSNGNPHRPAPKKISHSANWQLFNMVIAIKMLTKYRWTH